MKKYFSIILATVVVLIIIIITMVSNFKMFKELFGSNSGYAVKINNEVVGVNEFKTYLYEQKKEFEKTGGEDIWETDFDGVSAQEVAKQNAINSLVLVKTAVSQAPELKLFLNEEENNSLKEKAKQYQEKLKNETKIELSFSEAEKIVKEGILQAKVYEYVTKGFEMSESDFEAYFNEYYENNKKELNTVKVRYIFKSIPENAENSEAITNEANTLYERALMGEDFSKLQAESSDSKDKDIYDVKSLNFGSEFEESAYSLKQGEISDVVYTEQGFYIIKAESVILPDMEELKKEIRQSYEELKKQEIYQAQLNKWAETVVIEKNDKTCNEINIEEL